MNSFTLSCLIGGGIKKKKRAVSTGQTGSDSALTVVASPAGDVVQLPKKNNNHKKARSWCFYYYFTWQYQQFTILSLQKIWGLCYYLQFQCLWVIMIRQTILIYFKCLSTLIPNVNIPWVGNFEMFPVLGFIFFHADSLRKWKIAHEKCYSDAVTESFGGIESCDWAAIRYIGQYYKYRWQTASRFSNHEIRIRITRDSFPGPRWMAFCTARPQWLTVDIG